LFCVVHKGTYYASEEVKLVTAFVKAHYGQTETMASFSAERRAILAIHHSRAEGAPSYEIWAMQASEVMQSARFTEIRQARRVRREACVNVICSQLTLTHKGSILDRIRVAGYEDIEKRLRGRDWQSYLSARYVLFDGTSFASNPRPLTDRGECIAAMVVKF
jgi:hypothetical protein